MTFQEFLTKQGEVYDRFRNTSRVKTLGLEPTIPQSPQGGYLIILRHPKEIAERVADFSRRIADSVPAVVYDAETVHTTISDYGIQEGFKPDEGILRKLCQVVARRKIRETPVISYTEWLYNQNTAIVAGNPNETFLHLAEEIRSEADKEGINLRPPWGAHITTNRFKEKRTPQELGDFFRLMQEAPILGTSRPEFIDVAYFDFSPDHFNVQVHERFPLV
jgi:2'-5' RNA ligase